MKKACPVHGVWQPPPARCPRCLIERDQRRTGDVGWPGAPRNRNQQATFRRTVLEAADHQCQAIDAAGVRCPATTGLEAHHTVRGNYDPATGVALCRAHHAAVDRYRTPQD